jgi:hypothetical protein
MNRRTNMFSQGQREGFCWIISPSINEQLLHVLLSLDSRSFFFSLMMCVKRQ